MKLLKIYGLLRLCLIGLVLAIYVALARMLIEATTADPLAGLAKINQAQRHQPANQAVAKLSPPPSRK